MLLMLRDARLGGLATDRNVHSAYFFAICGRSVNDRDGTVMRCEGDVAFVSDQANCGKVGMPTNDGVKADPKLAMGGTQARMTIADQSVRTFARGRRVRGASEISDVIAVHDRVPLNSVCSVDSLATWFRAGRACSQVHVRYRNSPALEHGGGHPLGARVSLVKPPRSIRILLRLCDTHGRCSRAQHQAWRAVSRPGGGAAFSRQIICTLRA
jgi:hypothetical protein